MIGELTAVLFHYLFCRVVIGQCDRTVGCNRTPVIGQMKQPIKCLPFPTKMCKLKEIGEKDFFFLLLIIFSSATLIFFLSRPLFSISTSLFIHAQFFSPSATFSKPAPYSQSANFYCIFCWTARWPLKKTTLWLCFFAVILICVSFPLDCHCVLPDYLPALHLLTAKSKWPFKRYAFFLLFFFFRLLTRLHTPKLFCRFWFTTRTRQFKRYMSVPT